jgi:alkanesulfonate monooxygenase SsuD/methylene tetrahydromethanopterin reductase-like flavin-dependent oxidoreductase (luciferase family)
VTICVWALAADSDEQAQWQFKSRERSSIDREFGIRLPLVPPAEAASRIFSPAERAIAERIRNKAIVGAAPRVAERLAELAHRLQLDELVIVTWTYDAQPRHRSYELLAQEFALSPTSCGVLS